MADLKFEILEEFGTLATSKSGWELQLNFVQWGSNQPKFDLRTWSPDHKKMGKGITLTHDELVNLAQVIEQVLAPEQAVSGESQQSGQLLAKEAVIQDDEQKEVKEKPKWHKLADL